MRVGPTAEMRIQRGRRSGLAADRSGALQIALFRPDRGVATGAARRWNHGCLAAGVRCGRVYFGVDPRRRAQHAIRAGQLVAKWFSSLPGGGPLRSSRAGTRRGLHRGAMAARSGDGGAVRAGGVAGPGGACALATLEAAVNTHESKNARFIPMEGKRPALAEVPQDANGAGAYSAGTGEQGIAGLRPSACWPHCLGCLWRLKPRRIQPVVNSGRGF